MVQKPGKRLHAMENPFSHMSWPFPGFYLPASSNTQILFPNSPALNDEFYILAAVKKIIARSLFNVLCRIGPSVRQALIQSCCFAGPAA
jgi:hypothetical protein